MSLATRCTACGTVFRVVQDQLRMSGGWVRCGRCGEVFNAVESLVELDLSQPTEAAPLPSVHGSRVMQDLARVAGVPVPPLEPASAVEAAPDRLLPAEPPDDPVEDVERQPGDRVADPQDDAAAVSMPAPAVDSPEPPAEDDAAPAIAVEPSVAWEPSKPRRTRKPRKSRPAGEASATARTPAFVRQAERAAQWRRPRVRAGLAVLGGLAAVVLAAQLTLTYHDTMAARWPMLLPAIERLCAVGGCVIEPPRRIESLTVESSGLVRAGSAGGYRLSLVLRNRDRMALRVPFVDLTLTDAQGRTIARRVLEPAQLGASQPSLAAGAELPLAASLRVLDAGVVGYTIEIFYP